MADSARTPAPGEIIPVDGWAFKGEHGHMAFETTKGGRLVCLADLVQWLMDTEGLPCCMAVDDVCQKLQAPDAAAWLYMVTPGKMARPLTGKDDFSWHPIIVGRDPEPDPAHCGIAGAVRHMRSLWGDSASPSECTYIGANYLDPLAIRMDKAHELWGWGSVAGAPTVATSLELADVETWAQLVEWRLANVNAKNKRGPDWGRGSGKQLRILEAELARLMSVGAGKSAALNAMGRELGYTSAEPRKPMQKAIDAARKRKAAAPSAAPSLDRVTIVHSGQKVPKLPKAA